jgi:glycosyltransferase involved in cell wall biosynthesis
MNIDIVVVIASPIYSNVRAQKIVSSLSKKFKILLLDWHREKCESTLALLKNKNSKNILIKHFKLKAPYGSPVLILYYPLFWLWIIINIAIVKTKIIYACNLDTLIPCYFLKLFFKSKIVFDSFDKFSLAFIPPKNKLLFRIVDTLENVLTRNSDAFITVSKDRLLTYGKFIPRLVSIIMNTPCEMLSSFKTLQSSRSENYHEFIIVYAGGISWDRGLHLLKNAIRDFNNVRLILAGRIVNGTLRKLLTDPKIHYKGLLPYEEAIKVEAEADLIPILYDPILPINRLANPNKLFEAMMLGVPVITNVCKEIVNESGCGLVVEYNLKSVKEALQYFISHPEVRKKMGENGRRAFEEKYNWNLMEKKILKLLMLLTHNQDID